MEVFSKKYNYECRHEKLHPETRNCCKCGGIFFNNNRFAVKPSKYSHTVEVYNEEILLKLMKDSDSFNKTKQSLSMSYDTEKKRTKILKKLKNFIYKYKYKDQAYHLAVFLFDVIMSKLSSEKRNSPNLSDENIGVGCLILSLKFSELDPTIPDLTFFQSIYESVFYKVNDLRLYEVICLKILNYKLNFITPFMLIQHSVVNGILFTNDFNLYNNKEFDAQEIGLLSKAYTFIYEIIDFTVENYNYFNFSPFEILCSSIYLAREIVKLDKPWSDDLSFIFSVDLSRFEQCYNFLKENYFKIRTSRDVICLHISNEIKNDSINSSKNVTPEGPTRKRGSSSEVKINEVKKIKLDTYVKFPFKSFSTIKENIRISKSQDNKLTRNRGNSKYIQTKEKENKSCATSLDNKDKIAKKKIEKSFDITSAKKHPNVPMLFLNKLSKDRKFYQEKSPKSIKISSETASRNKVPSNLIGLKKNEIRTANWSLPKNLKIINEENYEVGNTNVSINSFMFNKNLIKSKSCIKDYVHLNDSKDSSFIKEKGSVVKEPLVSFKKSIVDKNNYVNFYYAHNKKVELEGIHNNDVRTTLNSMKANSFINNKISKIPEPRKNPLHFKENPYSKNSKSKSSSVSTFIQHRNNYSVNSTLTNTTVVSQPAKNEKPHEKINPLKKYNIDYNQQFSIIKKTILNFKPYEKTKLFDNKLLEFPGNKRKVNISTSFK